MSVWFNVTHIINYHISTYFSIWASRVKSYTFLHQLSTILESGYLKV